MPKLTIPVRFKRGTNAKRLQTVLLDGEGFFVKDYQTAGVTPLWMGNGTTAGGIDLFAAINQRLLSLEALTTSSDLNLDTIQEIVAYIKQNRDMIQSAAPDWTLITNKPDTFSPAPHSHNDQYWTKAESDTRYQITEIDGGELV